MQSESIPQYVVWVQTFPDVLGYVIISISRFAKEKLKCLCFGRLDSVRICFDMRSDPYREMHPKTRICKQMAHWICIRFASGYGIPYLDMEFHIRIWYPISRHGSGCEIPYPDIVFHIRTWIRMWESISRYGIPSPKMFRSRPTTREHFYPIQNRNKT